MGFIIGHDILKKNSNLVGNFAKYVDIKINVNPSRRI